MRKEDSHYILSSEQMHFCLVLIAISISILGHLKKSFLLSSFLFTSTAVNHEKKVHLCALCKDKIVYCA